MTNMLRAPVEKLTICKTGNVNRKTETNKIYQEEELEMKKPNRNEEYL